MTVIAMIEPIPADHTGGGESQVRELSAEAGDYAGAVAALRGQLPQGWRIMNLRR